MPASPGSPRAAIVLLTLLGLSACTHADSGEPATPSAGADAVQNETPEAPRGDAYFKSRVIVFYRDGVDSDSARAANAAVGATLLRPLAVANAAVLSLPQGMSVEEAIRRFKQQPGVTLAEPDGRATIR